MKKILTLSVSALAIVAATSAFGADIQRRQVVTKAPAYVTPVYNWTGLYAGINGGWGWGNSNFSAPFSTGGDFDVDGGLVGGTLGYNWQVNQAVFGIETDIAWSNINGSAPCAGTTCELRNRWLGTLRGRIGYAMDRFMPYVTGGLAYGDVRTTFAGLESSATKAGWTIGGGLEAALAGPWTAKIEYLYVDLGNVDTSSPATQAEFNSHIVRAGLNYRF
jgi:outer membrane immunogenic protein